MLFQPAILALLFAAAALLLLLAAVAPYVVQALRHWDLASGSELQLRLERRTYLMSTLLALTLATQVAALLLFTFNADRMAVMFVGAMCAVGTLNVNGYGFPALIAQIVLFFLASTWLILNRADNRARDYPLLRVKYALLLLILPFAAASFALQLNYFLNLRADVITSCCGSLFSGENKGLAAEMAGWSPRPAMAGFAAALALVIALGFTAARRAERGWHFALAGASVAGFIVALAGIISFVSLYVYEHPHHHCPFCLLKPEYGYQGYLLYLPLFSGTAAGIGAGTLQRFDGKPGLAAIVPAMTRRLAGAAALLYALFALVAVVMVWRSNLILLEG